MKNFYQINNFAPEAFENQKGKIPTVNKYETIITVHTPLYTNTKLLKIQLVYSPIGYQTLHNLYTLSSLAKSSEKVKQTIKSPKRLSNALNTRA